MSASDGEPSDGEGSGEHGDGGGDPGGRDPIARLAALPPVQRAWAIRNLPLKARQELAQRWQPFAHDGQYEPRGAWRIWLIRAGRGFGKTRAGAEWVSQVARDMPGAQIALVGNTAEDVAKVMIEGRSGLIAVARDHEAVRWVRARGEVRFDSGAVAHVYSANAAEGLRGPEHHAAWCDELAKWQSGDAAWDNLMMGLRAGERPRVVVTTTPRSNALMRRVRATKGVRETRGSTRDNPHLPRAFVADMESQYGGTRLGRQELDGEMIDDVAGALWTRATIEACRSDKAYQAVRTVVGVDPPASAGGDACGIVVAAVDGDRVFHVLDDASVTGASPEGWARAVAACAGRWRADRVVAEKNQGGDMVRSVLEAADFRMPVKLVSASKGKSARAEPVATLYLRGRVKHHGAFPALEDELCGLIEGGGYEGPGRSPDRADALVWAMTELMAGVKRGVAGVRTM